jgi:hypothetical protein
MVCSRRSFLKSTGALAASFAGNAPAQSTSKPGSYSDRIAADEWMLQWMQAPQAVAGALHLGRFADRVYFLRKQIGWTPNPGQNVRAKVRVPVGFVTDFASIPQAFWSALPPDGLYTYPAIIHDYLYWEQPVNRDEADLIFQYAMEDFKVPVSTIKTIYAGVRLGGGAAWNNNAALKTSGEKRILKVYPDDPTVRWQEWKNKPGVT